MHSYPLRTGLLGAETSIKLKYNRIRNLKCNEVLFSVNGTPVLTEIDRNLREANKRGGILLEDVSL